MFPGKLQGHWYRLAQEAIPRHIFPCLVEAVRKFAFCPNMGIRLGRYFFHDHAFRNFIDFCDFASHNQCIGPRVFFRIVRITSNGCIVFFVRNDFYVIFFEKFIQCKGISFEDFLFSLVVLKGSPIMMIIDLSLQFQAASRDLGIMFL